MQGQHPDQRQHDPGDLVAEHRDRLPGPVPAEVPLPQHRRDQGPAQPPHGVSGLSSWTPARPGGTGQPAMLISGKAMCRNVTGREPGGRRPGSVVRARKRSVSARTSSSRADSSSAVSHSWVSPKCAAARHSAGSSIRLAIQRRTSSKYCSATTALSSSEAAAAAGLSVLSSHWVNIAVARQGRSRPCPPGASSTSPYLASDRRWNEVLPELSPSSTPAWVAVSGPCIRSMPSSAIRSGCARARSARGSLTRVTERAEAASGALAVSPPDRAGGVSSPEPVVAIVQTYACKAFFATVCLQRGLFSLGLAELSVAEGAQA